MDFISGLIASPFICIGWIIVGIIAGALARRIMGSTNAPFWSDLVLGIIGAIVGGIIAGFVGVGPGPNTAGLELVVVNLIIATIGAIILIAIRRTLFRTAT